MSVAWSKFTFWSIFNVALFAVVYLYPVPVTVTVPVPVAFVMLPTPLVPGIDDKFWTIPGSSNTNNLDPALIFNVKFPDIMSRKACSEPIIPLL